MKRNALVGAREAFITTHAPAILSAGAAVGAVTSRINIALPPAGDAGQAAPEEVAEPARAPRAHELTALEGKEIGELLASNPEAVLARLPVIDQWLGGGALTDVALYAWIAQAAAGAVLEYHRGALAIDRNKAITTLGDDEAERIDHLAEGAFRAAEQDLVHLLQRRLGPRPKLSTGSAALVGLIAEVPDRVCAASAHTNVAA